VGRYGRNTNINTYSGSSSSHRLFCRDALKRDNGDEMKNGFLEVNVTIALSVL
jgi:hypothetical protein